MASTVIAQNGVKELPTFEWRKKTDGNFSENSNCFGCCYVVYASFFERGESRLDRIEMKLASL
jgi:hypothetical protein